MTMVCDSDAKAPSWVEAIGSRLPTFLDPADMHERHWFVAESLADCCDIQTVLDVGGRRGRIGRYLAASAVAANPDGTGDILCDGMLLPFHDMAFDAVVSLDTLEHVPREFRAGFVRECARVARKALVVTAPISVPGHTEAEAKLQSIHLRAMGTEQQYLADHLRHGLPTWDEVQTLFAPYGARFRFVGDYRAYYRQMLSMIAWRRIWSRMGPLGLSVAVLSGLRNANWWRRHHLTTSIGPYSRRFVAVCQPIGAPVGGD
jgi:SAM-dependent methyltransferase